MLSLSMHRVRSAAVLLLIAVGLSACAENKSNVNVNGDGGAAIKMTPPEFMLTRAINPNNLQLLVTINGQDVAMTKGGDTWTGSTTVPVRSEVALRVEWKEQMPDTSLLLLAIAEQTIQNVQQSIAFEVVDESYVTEGPIFDADGDLISNIVERRQDTDPNNANDPGVGPAPDVKVLASSRPNVIDGTFKDGSGFWDFATFSDVSGQDLLINNLIVSESSNTDIDGQPDYQWAAIHDTRYLTLFVWGKRLSAEGVTANGDSGVQFYNDDSVEIFLDGDFSRDEDGYDTVDDLHIIIPFVRGPGPVFEANNSADPDITRIFRGASVSRDVMFQVYDNTLVEFATCLCQSGNERMTMEIKIDMEAAKIPVGKTFGFDIQISRDDDGGARDSKWAWELASKRPDQTNAQADVTWRYADRMGKIMLLPF